MYSTPAEAKSRHCRKPTPRLSAHHASPGRRPHAPSTAAGRVRSNVSSDLIARGVYMMMDDPDIDFDGLGGDPDAEYVCRLDARSLETARVELNEDPRERLGAVKTFRQWLLQQSHIKSPTDTLFLLLFLRSAKFSQLKARERLEAFLSANASMPQWFSSIDTANNMIQAFFSTGYLLPLPGRTSSGEKVVMQRLGALDPGSTAYDKDTILKAACALTYFDLMNENVQVNGFIHLIDCTNFTMKHKMYWGLETAKKTMKLMNGFPARIKSMQSYNLGSVAESLFVLVKPFMPKKFQERIVIHGQCLENVYKMVPMEMLPLEYLPDDYDGPHAGTVDDIVQNLKRDITQPEVRQHILSLSNPAYGIDASKRPHNALKESFRKLIVD
ncbi:Clavesin-1 [Lamellibrachia satsuma]|nr:Clavesin-1 [Lamellibrachia satsuma]